jgi:hypothetical protein
VTVTRGQEHSQQQPVSIGRRERSKDGRRPAGVLLRLTNQERSALAERAEAQGISIQRYLLECAAAMESGAIPVETATMRREFATEMIGLRRLLANLANNMNQIAKVANSGGITVVQAEAVAAFQASRQASDRIFDLVDGLLEKRRSR